MDDIDTTRSADVGRPFDFDLRFAELAELDRSGELAATVAAARPIVQTVAEAVGRRPGLFLDDDLLEARWVLPAGPQAPARIVSVTFGTIVDVYVFDRTSGDVTRQESFAADSGDVADALVALLTEVSHG